MNNRDIPSLKATDVREKSTIYDSVEKLQDAGIDFEHFKDGRLSNDDLLALRKNNIFLKGESLQFAYKIRFLRAKMLLNVFNSGFLVKDKKGIRLLEHTLAATVIKSSELESVLKILKKIDFLDSDEHGYKISLIRKPGNNVFGPISIGKQAYYLKLRKLSKKPTINGGKIGKRRLVEEMEDALIIDFSLSHTLFAILQNKTEGEFVNLLNDIRKKDHNTLDNSNYVLDSVDYSDFLALLSILKKYPKTKILRNKLKKASIDCLKNGFNITNFRGFEVFKGVYFLANGRDFPYSYNDLLFLVGGELNQKTISMKKLASVRKEVLKKKLQESSYWDKFPSIFQEGLDVHLNKIFDFIDKKKEEISIYGTEATFRSIDLFLEVELGSLSVVAKPLMRAFIKSMLGIEMKSFSVQGGKGRYSLHSGKVSMGFHYDGILDIPKSAFTKGGYTLKNSDFGGNNNKFYPKK